MSDTSFKEHIKIKVDKPKNYNVLFYNDDKTTIDFVEYVLCEIFDKSEEEAYELTMKIHNSGCSVVGTYNKDGAYTRASDTIELARHNNFPLKVDVEEA